jgi:hypothetical protein
MQILNLQKENPMSKQGYNKNSYLLTNILTKPNNFYSLKLGKEIASKSSI